MENTNMKQRIKEAALELFSVQGFEATSVSQIGDAVQLRKASLYSHFESKQAILDELMADVMLQYNTQSIFAQADWENPAYTNAMGELGVESLVEMIQNQVRFILHDPQVSQGRKMLVIEQFRNPALAKLQTRQNYTDVIGYFSGLLRFMMSKGRIKSADPELMAAQLSLPITSWINLCDREPCREEEVMQLIGEHIRDFFRVHQ